MGNLLVCGNVVESASPALVLPSSESLVWCISSSFPVVMIVVK